MRSSRASHSERHALASMLSLRTRLILLSGSTFKVWPNNGAVEENHVDCDGGRRKYGNDVMFDNGCIFQLS